MKERLDDMTNQWWKNSVVYQIYPRSFKDSNGDGIGDLNGITEKLDYLVQLGVDVVWLSPVYESPNDDNGYDIRHYQKIMDSFGTMEDWENMLKEMHARGIKLIMDLVINHTSDEHAWFIESRQSKDNDYRDFYIWRPGKNGQPPNNWAANFGGSAWQYDEQTDEYYLHLFSKKQPDLNWENPALRSKLYDMIRWWLDKGIDGFRMDVINFISKDQRFPDGDADANQTYVSGHRYFMNGPRVHEFLQELHTEALAGHDILTVGEMPGVTPEEGKLYTASERKELNMVFHFEHMDIDSGPHGKWDVKPWSLVELKQILSKWQLALETEGWNSLYWNNHDQPRVVSRFGCDGAYRVVSAKMLATTLHMMKGTPYIYQGEELGMTNAHFDSIDQYRDIETINMYNEQMVAGRKPEDIMEAIHVKSRDNARTPMQWNSHPQAGFTTGEPWIAVHPNYKTVNADAALADPNSIFHYYRKLIELRKKYAIIVHGSFTLLAPKSEEIFAYRRSYQGEQLLVISNFTKMKASFQVPESFQHLKLKQVLIGNYPDSLSKDITPEIPMRPYETIVYHFIS